MRYVLVLSLLLLSVAALGECPREAECPEHRVTGTYSGEDVYPGGIHYRVYEHTTGDRDENGKLKLHKFQIRCD